MFFLSLLLLLPACSYSDDQDELSLAFVNVLWRHGARSSLYSFPSDIHKSSVWPQGPGQLTTVGMKEQYELGKYIKKRYANFLSANYSRTEIYVRSTDVDRTLMSAQCNWAGMYPPDKQNKWNGTDTNWQPLPVHTVPKDTDRLLRFPPPNSAKYNEILAKVWKSGVVTKFENKYAAFLREIANFTAFQGNLTVLNAYQIRDTLICEKFYNLSMPPWLTPDRMKKLTILSGFEMGLLFGVDTEYRTELAKLGAGNLVKKILDNMDASINNTSQYKMIAYSGHDTTLVALLAALNVFDMVSPPFASSIFIELYEKSSTKGSKSYIVRFFYRTSTTEPPKQLQILGCPLDCPLDELKKRASVIIPDDPPKDNPDQQNHESELLLALFVVTGVLICTLILMMFSNLKARCENRNRVLTYHRVSDEELDENNLLNEKDFLNKKHSAI